jgi:hypothetical protein
LFRWGLNLRVTSKKKVMVRDLLVRDISPHIDCSLTYVPNGRGDGMVRKGGEGPHEGGYSWREGSVYLCSF